MQWIFDVLRVLSRDKLSFGSLKAGVDNGVFLCVSPDFSTLLRIFVGLFVDVVLVFVGVVVFVFDIKWRIKIFPGSSTGFEMSCAAGGAGGCLSR